MIVPARFPDKSANSLTENGHKRELLGQFTRRIFSWRWLVLKFVAIMEIFNYDSPNMWEDRKIHAGLCSPTGILIWIAKAAIWRISRLEYRLVQSFMLLFVDNPMEND